MAARANQPTTHEQRHRLAEALQRIELATNLIMRVFANDALSGDESDRLASVREELHCASEQIREQLKLFRQD
jgi:hypothetical protein